MKRVTKNWKDYKMYNRHLRRCARSSSLRESRSKTVRTSLHDFVARTGFSRFFDGNPVNRHLAFLHLWCYVCCLPHAAWNQPELVDTSAIVAIRLHLEVCRRDASLRAAFCWPSSLILTDLRLLRFSSSQQGDMASTEDSKQASYNETLQPARDLLANTLEFHVFIKTYTTLHNAARIRCPHARISGLTQNSLYS